MREAKLDILDPSESLESRNVRLERIIAALVRRAEQTGDASEGAYDQFQLAARLEAQMQRQSADLRRTREVLLETNVLLGIANTEAETARSQLAEAVEVIAQGFALFGADERMVICNKHFCDNLEEVKAHLKPGLEFERYIQLLSTSGLVDVSEQGTPEAWAAWRQQMHHRPWSIFNVTLTNGLIFQVSTQRISSGATVLIHSDVTHLVLNERRERDAIVERQALLLQMTLEHLDQAVCIFDTEGKLIGQNQRLTEKLRLPAGLKKSDLNIRWILNHLRKCAVFTTAVGFDDLQSWVTDPSSRPPGAFELVLDGMVTLAMSCKTIPSWGIVFSFTDISAERAARDAMHALNEQLERRVQERTEALGTALQKAERATATKSRYLAAASHDLMQPLSSAKLFVSAISDAADSPDIVDIAQKTATSLAHLQDIIEALMDISRLDSDRVVMDLQPLNLNRVFQTLQEQFAPLAERKGLALTIVPSNLLVESDPGYLRRILENLISNAVRYTDSGQILLGARRRGSRARIEVRDTGRGLQQSDQSMIFEEFRKVDRSASEGLGLGLAIVKRASKALDHPIDIWSELGRGSCFSVSVPILDDIWAAEAAQDPEATEIADPACDGLIVLLVENDTQLNSALSMQIEAWGALAVPALSAADALKMLDEDGLEPDAMVLDYQLGDSMTGLDLFNLALDKYGPVPGLMMTANASESVLEEWRAAGLDAVNKPVDRARLLDFLNATARGQRGARRTHSDNE